MTKALTDLKLASSPPTMLMPGSGLVRFQPNTALPQLRVLTHGSVFNTRSSGLKMKLELGEVKIRVTIVVLWYELWFRHNQRHQLALRSGCHYLNPR
jgi:hypothetical protein